jgi:hypothetical protein
MQKLPMRLSAAIRGATALVTAATLAACGDTPTRPDAAPEPANAGASFSISDELRGQLHAALLFVSGEETMRALHGRDATGEMALAFSNLAQRVASGDRVGAERAVAGARRSVEFHLERHASYLNTRTEIRSDAAGTEDADAAYAAESAIVLGAMALTLEHAARLSRETPDLDHESTPTTGTRSRNGSSPSRKERLP